MAIGATKGEKRRLGRPNKRSLEIAEKLAALGCDPIEGMARIAIEAETAFAERLRDLNDGADIEISGLYRDLSLAGQMYKELAQYVAPKRKAVEHTGKDGDPIEFSRIERIIVRPSNPDR